MSVLDFAFSLNLRTIYRVKIYKTTSVKYIIIQGSSIKLLDWVFTYINFTRQNVTDVLVRKASPKLLFSVIKYSYCWSVFYCPPCINTEGYAWQSTLNNLQKFTFILHGVFCMDNLKLDSLIFCAVHFYVMACYCHLTLIYYPWLHAVFFPDHNGVMPLKTLTL